MRYRVFIVETDEGFSVSVPGLPGCFTQGGSEAEALENARNAIREYVADVEAECLAEGGRVVEVEVEVESRR